MATNSSILAWRIPGTGAWWAAIYGVAQPGREAALAWASLAQRFPASSVLARVGAGCGSVGDVPGAWLVPAPGCISIKTGPWGPWLIM